ncbi:MAG: DUF3991 domain-containing protein, partial [Ruminococcus sp.]|nr:DUF3991 domain-containing protein [Ruminococcus sp.]
MPKFTDEQVERAKNVDVRTFLEQTEGYTFEGHGRFLKCQNPQRTNQPSSLSIDTQMNRIFYNSVTGNRPLSAVDWCMKIKDMDFQSSMSLVLGENPQGERVEQPKYKQHTAQPKTAEYEPKNLELSERSDTVVHAKAYLTKTRCIPENIVNDCMSKNLIYEDVRRNAVFVGYDSDNKIPKYAARRGTFTPDSKEPFKRDCTGSDKNFAFRLEGKNTDTVYVAEAAIDVLSLAALEDKFHGSGAYKEKTYLSTGGAGIDSALEQFCKTHDVKTINVCFDDDEAGKNGMEKIMQKFRERGYTVNDMRASMAHDYNDELVAFNNDPNFYSKPPDVVVNSPEITTERSDNMPEQNISDVNQKSTEKALDEIINHYDCLYSRDDLDKLPDNDKKHIADIYYKRPYDENNPDTYDLDKKLNGDILEALNINEFKSIINADNLRQNGIEIEEIKTKGSIREDFYYEPSMSDEDMDFSFAETISSISFKNEAKETVTFSDYSNLKNALSNPDSVLMRSAGQIETENFIPFDDYYIPDEINYYRPEQQTEHQEVQPTVQSQQQKQTERSAQPEIKPIVQPQSQRQTEQRVQPEIKPTVQPQPQRQTEPRVQPDVKPTVQPQSQRQTEQRVQPEIKPTVQIQPQRQTEQRVQSEVKPTVQSQMQ